MDILLEAQQIFSQLISIRRRLHSFPETAWQEYETTQYIKAFLENLGLEIIPWGGETGVVALLHGRKPGKTVALRADMDALPIQENNTVPYASQKDGVMHACGHDAHMTCALGAAAILAKAADEISGTVKFIFQPAEELGGGGTVMVDKGVLLNPRVDAVFALHCQPGLQAGHIGIKEGPLMAGVDPFKITVTGTSGHGALPHTAVDPFIAAAAIVQALYSLTAREINSLDSAVLSLGMIHGGNARNIIPEKVEMTGTIRSFNSEVRDHLLSRVTDMVKSLAAAYRTEAQVRFDAGYLPVINPPSLAAFCEKSLKKLLTEKRVTAAEMVMVTEDFVEYQKVVPGVLMWLGTGGDGYNHPLHSCNFDIDEQALIYGAAGLAQLAADYLRVHQE